MYCIVSPFSKTFDNKGLIYFVPENIIPDIKEGLAVQIPLKNQIEIWIVLKIIEEKDIDIDPKKIKSLIWVQNKNILLSSYQIYLAFWISKYYFCQIHSSINLFLPKSIREKLKKGKLNDLIEKEKTQKEEKIITKNNIKLSKKQEISYNEILKSKNQKILFYWITWSWKTEIYIKLIEKYIAEWKQALLLIPEIILNNQIWEKIISYFWKEVLIINSSITDSTKAKYWTKIYLWKAKIIVWTRSSLFYPYKNLGIIIIDEQHDNSYISDKNPKFKTWDVVEKISELKKIKVVFASWTPSINYMYRAIKKELNLVNLLEKYNSK